MELNELLRGLNPEQRDAVTTIDGPVLVLAGAGTGKTRVITVRMAYMLATGIPPERILGMTFTNKAAREMRERLAQLVPGGGADKVTLGTFHSFCVRILRREISALNYLGNFTIADDSDQQGLVKQAIAQCGYGKDDISVSAVAAYISTQKNQLRFPVDAANAARNNFEASCAAVYRQYQELLELQNSVDFDDLLLLTYKIFSEFPEILAKYQERYRYLLIDEYQDTNDVQFEIVRMLCENHHNLCVVGDDDQSIYSWRGANIRNILDFPSLYPGTKAVKLEQNYRSTNTILQAANAVIGGGGERFGKQLWSDNGKGEPLLLVKTDDGECEADFIAGYINQMMTENSSLKPGDFAVLYRSNHLSRQLEISFRNLGVPYRLVGGQEFYQRKEIKDAAAYLKVLVNPRDNQSLLRILPLPPRGLAEKAVNLLKENSGAGHSMRQILNSDAVAGKLPPKGAAAARELAAVMDKYTTEFETPGNLAAKVTGYLRESGYLDGLQAIYRDLEDARKRRENVDEFINAIAQYEMKSSEPATLAGFLENFALLEENDRTEEPQNPDGCVTLSTIHAAKGLEYPVVFLMALEDNVFPHERAVEEGNLDEELRLFYVAITRAKRKLIITAAMRRMKRGVFRNQRASRFLLRLPEELYEVANSDELIKRLEGDDLTRAFENIFNLLK